MLARDRVYRKIRKDILSGVYRMGERLPVDDLAAQHGVSKTPVREALSALQHEGLVEIVPRVGHFVSHMTVKEVQNLFQLRLILEGASAQLAATCITDQELLELSKIPCSWVTGDVDSYLQYLADNREFHCKVAMATRNRHLADLIAGVLDQMQGLLLWELELRNRPEEFADEHRQLIEALRRHDGILARQVMETAIEMTQEALIDAIVHGSSLPVASSGNVSI
jgi:DNA-binding GntR family transcriptional regulator